MWIDIINEHNEILKMISLYNNRIVNGDYLEYSKKLDIRIYYDLLSAHIVNVLLNNPTLYMPKEILQFVHEMNSEVMNYVEWNACGERCYIKDISALERTELLQCLVNKCFNEQESVFLQEVCAQDILCSGELAPKISSLLSSIRILHELSCLGIEFTENREDEFVEQISKAQAAGKLTLKPTEIEVKFNKEYRKRGALIRGREFRHNCTETIPRKVICPTKKGEALNYKKDGVFCQFAVIHISVEENGSSGTGFKISDNYALTCAHVVEGAQEIYANVICGDGYPKEGREAFGIYDVGFGEVVYSNKSLDIALLKTEYCGTEFLSIETRNILPELGEEVVVFGYPLGYEMPQTNRFGPNISFYRGYVSSNQVDNGNSITFLDIDVKSGNSGSPVISTKTGKVIGIISGIKVGGQRLLSEKMPYMIPIQHFLKLSNK